MVRTLRPYEGRMMRPWSLFEDEMQGLMSRFFGREDGGWLTEAFTPSANLVESEGEFEVTVELPGLKPEEVNVEFKEGALWITGQRKEEKEEKGKTYHRVERRTGSFRRMFELGHAINEEAIEAHFEDGVLKVRAPKTEAAKPKHIEVKT
ncbi:MAG: Hsp20/alpha crystallin family protein [Pirellulaceae bacterium]